MDAVSSLEAAAAWVVRRGGLSRITWCTAAAGLGVAAITGIGPREALGPAILGLVVLALLSILGMAAGGAPSRVAGLLPFALVFTAGVVGLLWGAVRVDSLAGGELVRLAGGSVVIRAEVTAPPRPGVSGAAGVRFFARSLGPLGGGEGLLVESPDPIAAEEGALVDLRGTLRLPESAEGVGRSGGFDERAWLAREAVGVVLETDPGGVSVVGRRAGLAGVLDQIRKVARSRLSIGLDPGTSSVLKGVVLGDKAAIPEETLDDFRRSGVAHILAVSGLHVGALAAGAYLLFRSLRLTPAARTMGAAAIVVLFALVTGAGPSVVRASVMALAMLTARLIGRGRDSWGALGLAATVILGANPMAVTDPGFQLSFSAVAALLALTTRLERRVSAWLPGWSATAVAVSLAAGVGTAPVSLFTFGQASVVGVLANPLVVPVVPFIMALGFAGVVAGVVYAPLAALPNTFAGVLIGWVSTVARVAGAAPVVTPGNAVAIALAAAGSWVGWKSAAHLDRPAPRGPTRRGVAPRASARRGVAPRGPTRRGLARRGLAAVLGATLLALVPGAGTAARDRLVTASGARGWPEHAEVRVLDVGEGNSTLVRSSEGVTVLVDAGPAGETLADDLRRLGVSRIDAVVVSHPHADHFGGLEDIVDEFDVGLFIDHIEDSGSATAPSDSGDRRPTQEGSVWSREADSYLALRQRALERGARHVVPRGGSSLTLGGVTLGFEVSDGPLRPVQEQGGVSGWTSAAGSPDDGPELSSDGLNAASLVVVVRVEGLAILVPGDAEAPVLSRFVLSDVDGIVVPHHGSRGAVSTSLLRGLSPEVAVVSAGEDNGFGHPHPETLGLIGDAAVPVFRTDVSGWVAMRVAGDEGSSFTVSVERDGVDGSASAGGHAAAGRSDQ